MIEFNIETLCSRKKIDIRFFNPSYIELEDSVNIHATHIFHGIYSVPYIKEKQQDPSIARYYHGMAHHCRVGILAVVLVNLLRKHGNFDALNLTDEELKLLIITCLFHDTARETDGEDLWDLESATFAYFYFTRTLGVNHITAKKFAEAIANKDAKEGEKYYYIDAFDGNKITWQETVFQPKNIQESVVHDADAFDILRAREAFDAAFLDLYQKMAKYNEVAFNEMALLITEIRSFIEHHGDGFNRTDPKIKKLYEHHYGYNASLKLMQQRGYPLLNAFYNNGQLAVKEDLEKLSFQSKPYVPAEGLTAANMTRALHQGKIVARAVAAPSAIAILREDKTHSKKKEDKYSNETNAAREIRKVNRRFGQATKTSKKNALDKDGNPNRSVSMLGFGGGVFTDAGFLIVDLPLTQINSAFLIDSGTGRGNRKGKYPKITLEEWNAFVKKQKMGGKAVRFWDYYGTHNELLAQINDFHAIYFSQDSCLFNEHIMVYSEKLRDPKPFHKNSPYLQALYLQREYMLIHNKTLPIFEYSGVDNFIKPVAPLSEDDIVKLWIDCCVDVMKSTYSDGEYDLEAYKIFAEKDISAIKAFAVYGTLKNPVAERNASPDLNYPSQLSDRISSKILEKLNEITEQHEKELVEEMARSDLGILSDKVYYYCLNNHDFLRKNIGYLDKISYCSMVTFYKYFPSIGSKISANQNAYNQFRGIPYRAYKLNSIVKNTSFMKRMEKEVCECVTEELSRAKYYPMSGKDTITLVSVLEQFNSYDDHFKLIIKGLATLVLDDFNENVKSTTTESSLSEFLERLEAFVYVEILTPAEIQIVVNKLKMVDFPDSYSKNFFRIIEILKLKKEDIREKILEFIKDNTFYFARGTQILGRDEFFATQLLENGWLNDEEIARNLLHRTADFRNGENRYDLLAYLDNIEQLMSHFPNKQFTIDQQKIIVDRVNDIIRKTAVAPDNLEKIKEFATKCKIDLTKEIELITASFNVYEEAFVLNYDFESDSIDELIPIPPIQQPLVVNFFSPRIKAEERRGKKRKRDEENDLKEGTVKMI